ncbi:MAG: ABC transporter substrate-binding protein [Sterolibacterium sp.]|nr:ABC transporter substrate-binding protein [Sterolibacterium sp.]
MKLFSLLVAGFTLLLPAVAQAQKSPVDIAPDQLIKNVSNEVLEIVRKDKDIQSGNSKKVLDLVEAKVLPNFNFTHMTQLALARDWRVATPAQKATLTEEFRTLLVRTYSKALTEYKNQTIEFKPLAMKPGETDVKVRTNIVQPGAKPVALDYFVEALPQGWKVYDIEVSGISLVTNYRESFATEVRNGGIDGLIATLQTKNRSAESK